MKTKKRPTIKIMATVVLLIIAISNTPPAQFFLLESYTYQNKDGSFTYGEESGKGMDFEAGLIQFDGWKQQHPDNPNTILYRTFPIRPWAFWEWWQYIAHSERFALPYISDAGKNNNPL